MSSERRRPDREPRTRGRRMGSDPFGVLWDDAAAARPARGRGRGRGGGLGREEIVATALRIADAEGADAISMRRIARELGAGTMSLYHHVPTKDDLLDLMFDEVMGELLIDESELSDDWREALAQISRRTREVYERHEWVMSSAWERPQMGPRAFAHIEQSLSIFEGLDLPVQQVGEMLGAADDYVAGFVGRHAATRRAMERSGLSMDEFQRALEPYVRRLVAEGDYPNLRRFVDEEWRVEEAPRFEQGLQWLLAGMAQALRSAG